MPGGRIYNWHLTQAGTAFSHRHMKAVSFHLTRLRAEEPPDLVCRLLRGRVFAQAGDWEAAAADFVKVFESWPPDDEGDWLEYGRAQLFLKDLEGCRLLSARAFARFGIGGGVRKGGIQPQLGGLSIRLCGLLPDGPVDKGGQPAGKSPLVQWFGVVTNEDRTPTFALCHVRIHFSF